MISKKTAPMLRREAGLRVLSSLLAELRSIDALREVRPGSFKYRSRAFLHFHYHPDGKIFADARLSGADFTRFDVSTPSGQQELLSAIRLQLAD